MKIPIILGINDNPLPPNYLNNGRGANGSFISKSINILYDLFEAQNVLKSHLQVTHNLPDVIEVGEPLPSVLFTWSLPNNLDIYCKFFHGDSLQSLSPITGEKFKQGSVFELEYPDYINAPNVYLHPKTRVYVLRFYLEGFEQPLFERQFSITWKEKIVITAQTGEVFKDYEWVSIIHMPAEEESIMLVPEAIPVIKAVYTSEGVREIEYTNETQTRQSSLGLEVITSYRKYILPTSEVSYNLYPALFIY